MFIKAFTTTVLVAATFAFAPATATAVTPVAPVVISSVSGSGGAL